MKKFIAGKSWVEVSGAVITDKDKEILHSVVDDGWYTEGKWCMRFENSLKEITGKKYVQLVNSGSSASLVAMTSALRKFDPKHEKPYVVTCATAFPTTVNPIYQNGRIPIYVDIDPFTLQPLLQMAETVAYKQVNKLSGTIFTHTMGFPFHEEFMKGYVIGDDKFLISDGCDALGSKARRTFFHEYYPVGTFADITTYSFFPAHHITSGEGGAVVTDDPILAELARCYSNWGRSCFCQPGQSNTCGNRFTWEDKGELPDGWDHKYIFSELGYNLKMTEFQGALGYSQSLRLKEIIDDRRSNYLYLYHNLNKKHVHLIELPENTSPFGFPILVNKDAPFTARELISFLEVNKIRTRRLFAGNITKQPGYINLPSVIPYELKGSDRVMNDMLWVGCFPGITQEMLDYMIEIFNSFMEKY